MQIPEFQKVAKRVPEACRCKTSWGSLAAHRTDMSKQRGNLVPDTCQGGCFLFKARHAPIPGPSSPSKVNSKWVTFKHWHNG